jgi:hypothetical protein
MASASIQIKGLEGLKKKLKVIPEKVATEIDADMHVIANDFVNRAVNDAPVDRGELKLFITAKKEGLMNYEIVSGAPYSAYIEFGTKSRFKPIPGIDSSKFRGTGGKEGGKGFYDSILEWVKRKGIAGNYSPGYLRYEKGSKKRGKRLGSTLDKQIEDEQAAYAIYLSIMRHGVHAHPFFFKQMPIAQSEAQKSFKQSVKRALK